MFDPFNDYDQAGYLRNFLGEKNLEKVKLLEEHAFVQNLTNTLMRLSETESLNYDNLKETHRLLFSGLYPWSGDDRTQNHSNHTVKRGDIEFASPYDIQRAFNAGLDASTLGKTLGYWAYAHPFLECNGRAIFTFFSSYISSQGLTLDWPNIDAQEFLGALGDQVNNLEGRALDQMLDPYFQVDPWADDVAHVADLLMRVNWRSP